MMFLKASVMLMIIAIGNSKTVPGESATARPDASANAYGPTTESPCNKIACEAAALVVAAAAKKRAEGNKVTAASPDSGASTGADPGLAAGRDAPEDEPEPMTAETTTTEDEGATTSNPEETSALSDDTLLKGETTEDTTTEGEETTSPNPEETSASSEESILAAKTEEDTTTEGEEATSPNPEETSASSEESVLEAKTAETTAAEDEEITSPNPEETSAPSEDTALAGKTEETSAPSEDTALAGKTAATTPEVEGVTTPNTDSGDTNEEEGVTEGEETTESGAPGEEELTTETTKKSSEENAPESLLSDKNASQSPFNILKELAEKDISIDLGGPDLEVVEKFIRVKCYLKNEVFTLCGGYIGCQRTLKRPIGRKRGSPGCPYICVPGCKCKSPKLRNEENNECVLPKRNTYKGKKKCDPRKEGRYPNRKHENEPQKWSPYSRCVRKCLEIHESRYQRICMLNCVKIKSYLKHAYGSRKCVPKKCSTPQKKKNPCKNRRKCKSQRKPLAMNGSLDEWNGHPKPDECPCPPQFWRMPKVVRREIIAANKTT